MKQFSIILFFICSFCSYGQQIELLGFLKNVEGEPVPFANIIVHDTTETQKPITFGYSDGEGHFSLEIPSGMTKVILNVTAIGYQEKEVEWQTSQGQPFTVAMEESITNLEEVVVKARKITDTLNIDTEGMNLSKESTLRDMLDKTDGVILGEEGGISYQGKQINKVLINGKEVFVNQNKVALDNLNYEIMENVQIIDNYKDKFTLDFKRIRDPVINIETKSRFKGVLKAQVDLGYGFKEKYGLNGKGFFFSDKLNAFATSHTNNTGKKELSEKDVSASVKKYATEELDNILYPFFIEDYRTSKNFVSNNSLTFRWQGLNSKSGLVFYYGNIHTERKADYSTFIADTLVKRSGSRNSEKGNFISATANYSHILSPRTVLQNVLSTIGIGYRKHNESVDTLFVPTTDSFGVRTQDAPENFSISNDLKLTHLLNDNTAFSFDLDYYHERNTRDFETRLTNIDVGDILQEGSSSKQYLLAQGNFNFRLRKATLNTGLAISNNNESGDLEFLNNAHEDSGLKRNIFTLGVPLSLDGSFKNLDYSFSAAPTLIRTGETDNRSFLKMFHSLTYNFEAQNNLRLGMGHSYQFYDINALFDTIVKSYNHKIINERGKNLDQFSVKDEVSLSWFNSNVARSKNIHFTYRYSQEQDFLQSVLDSISDNVFYYSNKVFDKNRTHTISAGGKKGIYLGPAYHRLDIGAGLNFMANRYSTIFNDQSARAKNNMWEPAFNLSFLPRRFFMKEITNQIKWNHLIFSIDGDKVTQQSVTTNTFTVKGHGDKINWNFDFEYMFYNIDRDKFSVPDCNLSFKYDVSDTLSFSLVGRSLLTLFQLNNYNFANTLSNGNTLTRIRTDNNLGYLIFYTSFRF